MDFRIIKHYNKDGTLTTEHWSIASGVLIGKKIGKVYQPTGANHWSYDHNPLKGAQTYSDRMLIHAVAPGTQIKFFLKFHMTTNANGETTAVNISGDWVSCK